MLRGQAPLDGVSVRPASVSDAEAIARFQTETWREAYAGLVSSSYLDGVSTEDRVQRWSDRIVSKERRVLVASEHEEIVGVVSWGAASRPEAGSVVELKSLYVTKSQRGTGLAIRLLNAAIKDLAAELWVFRDNSRARNFYEKSGFVTAPLEMIDPDTGLVLILMTRPTAGDVNVNVGEAMSRTS